MRRILAGALAAVVLVGAGVGGTLSVQHVTGGASADCRIMNDTVHSWLHPATAVPNSEAAGYYRQLNDVLDSRYKVCNP
jgi:hypothetical protein